MEQELENKSMEQEAQKHTYTYLGIQYMMKVELQINGKIMIAQYMMLRKLITVWKNTKSDSSLTGGLEY